MDRADNLRRQRDNYSVKLREFLIAYAKDSSRLYCFFEGKDDKYYSVRINALVPQSNYANIECKGKQNLLDLYNSISLRNDCKSAWLAFFVDRDFDLREKIPTSDRLYCTSCYSIENFYVSLEVFQSIISSEFNISDISEETQEDFHRLSKLYQDSQEKFHNAIEELNAWLYLQHHKRAEGQQQKRLNLNVYELDKFVYIDINNIQKKYDLSHLNDLFTDAIKIASDELAAVCLKLSVPKNERCKVFRGKYEIEFLRTFLGRLREDAIQNTPSYFQQKKRVSLNLSRDNIISELSQYADTPNCLIEFLEKVKNKRQVTQDD